ncbi:MAG TPA: hypothetical protein VL463_03030 [Kofleriaceae bacterium]|jgi:hypothetical protein|nr:hypothetical protein [Kofleriaceae bacterium]
MWIVDPDPVRSSADSIHQLVGVPLLAHLLWTAFGIAGLLALVLATRGSRPEPRESARRTARLAAMCLVLGIAVAAATGALTTRVSFFEGRSIAQTIDRGGWPIPFALAMRGPDTDVERMERSLATFAIDAACWAAMIAFALARRELARPRYVSGPAAAIRAARS